MGQPPSLGPTANPDKGNFLPTRRPRDGEEEEAVLSARQGYERQSTVVLVLLLACDRDFRMPLSAHETSKNLAEPSFVLIDLKSSRSSNGHAVEGISKHIS